MNKIIVHLSGAPSFLSDLAKLVKFDFGSGSFLLCGARSGLIKRRERLHPCGTNPEYRRTRLTLIAVECIPQFGAVPRRVNPNRG